MSQDWHLRWVRVPEGTHLSDSKDTPGVERDLLREDGSNRILGPTESFPADEDALLRAHAYEIDVRNSADVQEFSSAQQALADAIAEVLETVIREAVLPAVKQVVAPALKRKLSGIAKRLQSSLGEASGQVATTELAVLAATPAPDTPKELHTVAKASSVSMSNAEFRERFIAVLAAEAYAAEQKKLLLSASVKDDDFPPELTRAIKLVIEGNVSLLAEGELAAVLKLLGEVRIAEVEYVLPEIEEAQRLTDDGM